MTFTLIKNSCGCTNQDPVQIIDDQFYTFDMCNEKCLRHQTCFEFAVGKGPLLSGKCYLHNVGCDHVSSDDFDCFLPSPPNTKPSEKSFTCTHQLMHVNNAAQIASCLLPKTKASCQATPDCVWNPCVTQSDTIVSSPVVLNKYKTFYLIEN